MRYKLKIALFRSPLCFNFQRDSNGAYKTLYFFQITVKNSNQVVEKEFREQLQVGLSSKEKKKTFHSLNNILKNPGWIRNDFYNKNEDYKMKKDLKKPN